MLFHFYPYLLLLIHKDKPTISQQLKASIVLCARNEENNILQCIQGILKQEGSWELILVDDGSSDGTSEIMKSFVREDVFYHRLDIDKSKFPGKKYALQFGIEQANNPIIIVTDADCIPYSSQWVVHLLSQFDNQTELVIGYGPYWRTEGLFNLVAIYECIYTAIKYLSLSKVGLTYMGVGRNMAYRKQTFTDNKGFSSHLHIASGDDDLFVRDIAKRCNTRIVTDKKSHMYSMAASNWKAFLQQKKRHLSVGFEYGLTMKFILGMELIAVFGFYLFFLLIFLQNKSTELALCLLLCKLLIHSLVFGLIARNWGQPMWILRIAVIDILHLISYIYISATLLINKKITWR